MVLDGGNGLNCTGRKILAGGAGIHAPPEPLLGLNKNEYKKIFPQKFLEKGVDLISIIEYY